MRSLLFKFIFMGQKSIRRTIAEEGVGMLRHDNYHATISRINEAREKGFYIECVSLIEGLLADRMESLANQMDENNDHSHKTLGHLIKALCNCTPVGFDEVIVKIDKWRELRNTSIHELPKNLEPSFAVRYAELLSVADEGMALFREFDKLLSKYRASIKK